MLSTIWYICFYAFTSSPQLSISSCSPLVTLLCHLGLAFFPSAQTLYYLSLLYFSLPRHFLFWLTFFTSMLYSVTSVLLLLGPSTFTFVLASVWHLDSALLLPLSHFSLAFQLGTPLSFFLLWHLGSVLLYFCL